MTLLAFLHWTINLLISSFLSSAFPDHHAQSAAAARFRRTGPAAGSRRAWAASRSALITSPTVATALDDWTPSTSSRTGGHLSPSHFRLRPSPCMSWALFNLFNLLRCIVFSPENITYIVGMMFCEHSLADRLPMGTLKEFST